MSSPDLSVRLAKNQVHLNNKYLCSVVMHRLHVMRKKGQLCDVSLVLGDSSSPTNIRASVKAHACVLTAASALFSDIFNQSATSRYVQLKDFDRDILDACLDYMYGQEVHIPTNRVEALKTASESLRLTYLTVQCSVALDTIKKHSVAKTVSEPERAVFASNLSFNDACLQGKSTACDHNVDMEDSCTGTSQTLLPQPKDAGTDVTDSEVDHSCVDTLVSQSAESQTKTLLPDFTEREPESLVIEESRKTRRFHIGSESICQESDTEIPKSRRPDKHQEIGACKSDVTSLQSEERAEEDCEAKGQSKQTRQERKRAREKARRDRYKKAVENNEEKDTATFTRKYKRMTCGHCSRTFAGTDGLKKHQAVIARNPNFTARVVYSTKEEKQKAKNENRVKLEKKEYICKDCGLSCMGWSKYNVHRRLTHNVSLVCQYCSKVFAWPHSLRIHEKRHEQAKSYACSQCTFRAVSKTEVDHHEQRKHLNNTYVCSFCSATFRCQLNLKKHELYSHLREPIKCPYCDYTGNTEKSVERHVLNKHFPEKRELWPCTICSKEFTRKGHLDRHLKDVHREKPKKLGPATVNSELMKTLESTVESEISFPSKLQTKAGETSEPDFTIESQEISGVNMPTDLYFIRDEMGNLYRCDNMGNLSTLLEGDVQPTTAEPSAIQEMPIDDKMEVLDY